MADEPQIPSTDQKENPSHTPPAADPKQAPDGSEKPENKSLTQADIDNAVKERLAREKKKHEEELAQMKAQIEATSSTLNSYQEKEEQLRREAEEKEREKALAKGEFERLMKMDQDRFENTLKAERENRAKLEAERDALRKNLESTKIDTQLYAVASQISVDPSDVVELVKRAHNITLDPNTHGVVIDGDADATLDQIVKNFLDKKPHLAKTAFDGKAGGGSQVAPPPPTATFTREQVSDPTFYRANRDAIIKAQMEGRIREA